MFRFGLQSDLILGRLNGRLLSDWGISGAELSTVYTSPAMYFDSGVTAGTTITVAAGLTYSLDGGAFTGDAGVRGTAKKIQFRLTSSASYETLVSFAATVGSVTYTISATTAAAILINAAFPYTFPFEVA